MYIAPPFTAIAALCFISIAGIMSVEQEGIGVPRIRVVVRKRPLNSSEVARKEVDVLSVDSEDTLTVHEPKTKVDMTKYIEKHSFVFDEVFSEDVGNREIYERTAAELIDTLFERGKATCFAYGQTGSGKTHTMIGGKGEIGLYSYAARDIFNRMASIGGKVAVYVSFFEIYAGQLYDLFSERKKLVAREDANHKTIIVGLEDRYVDTVDSLMQLIDYGQAVRSTGATGANMDSSRSHAILQIKLKTRENKLSRSKGPFSKPREPKEIGKISFIDLAGSERGADTLDVDRMRRMEGAEINKSLLALKECIRAMDQGSKHLPFRGSKLTQVLKDSFMGKSRTVMIANVSPNNLSCEHTLNTLRYADRVKELKKGSAAPKTGNENLPSNHIQQAQHAAYRINYTAAPAEIQQPLRNKAALNVPSSAQQKEKEVRAINPSSRRGSIGSERDRVNPRVEASFEATPDGISALERERRERRNRAAKERDERREKIASKKSWETPDQRPVASGRPSIASTESGPGTPDFLADVLDDYLDDNDLAFINDNKGGKAPIKEPIKAHSKDQDSRVPLTDAMKGGRGGVAFGVGIGVDHSVRQRIAPTKDAVAVVPNTRKFENVYDYSEGSASDMDSPMRSPSVAISAPQDECVSLEVEDLQDEDDDEFDDDDDDDLAADSMIEDGEYSGDEDSLAMTQHEELISNILDENEDIIAAHRQQVQDMMELIKNEMRILNAVEQPGSVIDDYVSSLDSILDSKVALIIGLKERLSVFKKHLCEEEMMSRRLSGTF